MTLEDKGVDLQLLVNETVVQSFFFFFLFFLFILLTSELKRSPKRLEVNITVMVYAHLLCEPVYKCVQAPKSHINRRGCFFCADMN